ncbi:methionyl-tRNA formyltransferase [Georgenia sp. Z1491]|uniref:methionyl-tRNA formyltransferase n=1 Tax=Georgenia sp. Z1491 TaxID=3416707 RepID=UPI003CF71758
MRVLFAGTPVVALPALHHLLQSQHEVVGVLTRAPAPRGRGRTLHPSPVGEAAAEAGLPVLTPRTLRDDDVVEEIRELGADVAAVVAYGLLVPPPALAATAHGWVNLHFSLLPAYRGAAPVQHALLAGEDVTGATTFLLDEGLDTGPVLATMTETIQPTDTSGALLDRLSVAGARLLTRSLETLVSGLIDPAPQSALGVSTAPKLDPSDGLLDLDAPAERIDRVARATTPSPGPWTTLPDGSRLKLRPFTLRPDVTDLAPGELRETRRDVLVGTATHALQLTELAPAGKSWMAADAWARGARLEAGDRLGAHRPGA